MAKKTQKKLPAAPLGAKVEKVKKNPVFEKRNRNFRIGGDIQPTRNLTRFVKWPQYIRLQRQKRILLQRIKMPPTLAQFQHTIDKTQFLQLARLLKKIAPETKAQKKERLRDAAEKEDVKTGAVPVVKFGINHVCQLVEERKAKLVIIAHDVDPVELVCWLPALCRKKDIPYCIVKSKSRLGQLCAKKTATCLAVTNVKKEDQKDLDAIAETMKTMFNENKDLQKRWGGGIMGVKSNHIQRYKQMLVEKELAKKTGLML